MTRVRIDRLGGVPLLYDRRPASNYGVTGTATRPYIDSDFQPVADRAFHELFDWLAGIGAGTVSAILFGGIGRTGSGPSLHHQNRAFDLDGLTFREHRNWVADTFPDRPHFYLAVEATLRSHVGTVLTYGYNADHRDHLHFDDGRAVGFRRDAKSHTLFLQNAIVYLFDIPLGIDGMYGPETRQAERRVRDELGLGSLSDKANWLEFLAAARDLAGQRLIGRMDEAVATAAVE